MHLTEAISLFLDACIAEGKSNATYKIYCSCLNSLLRFTGDCLLSDVDEKLLRSYLKSLRLKQEKHDSNPYRPTVGKPLSGETIRTYYRHIRVFLGWCYDEGLMEHNPTLRVKMPPAPRRGPKRLSDEDFWAMVEAAGEGSTTGARDRALVLTLGDTGARARGIVGLTLDQLDLDSALIEVVEKGDKSRIIPISEITI